MTATAAFVIFGVIFIALLAWALEPVWLERLRPRRWQRTRERGGGEEEG